MAERNIKMNVKTDTGYDTLYPQTKADIVSFNDAQSVVKGKTVQENLKNTANALYHPNLLINGDFLINTRGLSVYDYTKRNGYTIDKWFINELKVTPKKNNNFLKIENLTALSHGFRQRINLSKNKNYMAVIKIINIQGNNNEVYLSTNETNIQKLITGVNVVSFNTRSREINDISIDIPAKTSVDLEYFDLFEGTTAYPHQVENEIDAYNRCCKFITYFNTTAVPIFLYGSSGKYRAIFNEQCISSNGIVEFEGFSSWDKAGRGYYPNKEEINSRISIKDQTRSYVEFDYTYNPSYPLQPYANVIVYGFYSCENQSSIIK